MLGPKGLRSLDKFRPMPGAGKKKNSILQVSKQDLWSRLTDWLSITERVGKPIVFLVDYRIYSWLLGSCRLGGFNRIKLPLFWIRYRANLAETSKFYIISYIPGLNEQKSSTLPGTGMEPRGPLLPGHGASRARIVPRGHIWGPPGAPGAYIPGLIYIIYRRIGWILWIKGPGQKRSHLQVEKNFQEGRAP